MDLFLIGVKQIFYWVPFKTEITYAIFRASLVGLVVKDPPDNAGDVRHRFNSRVGKILCRRVWQPTPAFLPRKSTWTEEPEGLQSMGSQRVTHAHVPRNIYCIKYWRSMQIWYCLIFNIKIPNKEDSFLDISFIYS